MIMKEHEYYKESAWNRSESRYTFETGSVIEFFSADQGDKLRGARRDRLFLNEANNISFTAFEELEVRTQEFIYIDYNPTNEFWVFTEVIPKRNDVQQVIVTYKDNESLSKEIIASIEQRRNRVGWFLVYGLGQLGEVDGKIYKDWLIIDSVPHEARLVRRGLDFGYTNDPTAIVDIYYYNGGFILDEKCYRKGMSNRMIADMLLDKPDVMVVADSAEPKSIAELCSYGLVVVGASKGKDSVMNGIQVVQDQRISVTKRSVNIIREYRNYLFETDKDGKILNIPEHAFSHSQDAIRYGINSYIKSGGVVSEEEYKAESGKYIASLLEPRSQGSILMDDIFNRPKSIIINL
jgi:phage terminase large subunit